MVRITPSYLETSRGASCGVRGGFWCYFWRDGSVRADFREAGTLSLFELDGDRYQSIPASGVLRGIDTDELLRFVEVRPMTRAVRQYRELLGGAGE
jgi:hypothetical protein